MIIEYLGVPGSGKSFLANKYKEELKAKEIPFLDLSRWKGMPLWLKVFYKITDKCLFVLPKYRKLRGSLKKICKKYAHVQPSYLPFSIDYCIERIVSSVLLQDVFGKCKKITINDEGLLQWVVFLNVQYGIDIKNILNQLKPFSPNVKVQLIDISIEQAFENIKKRNRHICPMDEMADCTLVNYLEDFHNGCYIVYKQYVDNK